MVSEENSQFPFYWATGLKTEEPVISMGKDYLLNE